MTKFKNIEALGLSISEYNGGLKYGTCFVYAADLEALLEKGVRVYGVANSLLNSAAYSSLTEHRGGRDTHTGILIDYKPIPKPKPVSKEEIKNLLISVENWLPEGGDKRTIVLSLKRILESGVE